jgi:outer membrane lipoprotein-sorting protein
LSFVVFGQAEGPTGAPSLAESQVRSGSEAIGAGQSLIQQVQAALERNYTVSAQITQTARLLGHEVIGSGTYVEQRSNQGLLFRCELNVQTRDDKQPSSLLQICDGGSLWMYRKLAGAESLSRVDLAFVHRRLNETGRSDSVNVLDQWPGAGGLSRLLRSYDQAFLFDEPESVQLQSNFPAWKVEGRWRPEMLVRAVPDHKEDIEQGRGVALEELPEHLPNSVILFLGKDDLFPYSIAFYRLNGTTADVKASPSDQPVVRINMTNVRFNQPIHAAQFVYKPGDLEYADQTEQLLQKLGLE